MDIEKVKKRCSWNVYFEISRSTKRKRTCSKQNPSKITKSWDILTDIHYGTPDLCYEFHFINFL